MSVIGTGNSCSSSEFFSTHGARLVLALGVGMAATFAQAASLTGVQFPNSGSGFNWSSDLGIDYGKAATDEPGYGGGITLPARPNYAGFDGGESLYNHLERADFGLLSEFKANVAAAGDVEGKTHYVKITNTVPAVGIYGLSSNPQRSPLMEKTPRTAPGGEWCGNQSVDSAGAR